MTWRVTREQTLLEPSAQPIRSVPMDPLLARPPRLRWGARGWLGGQRTPTRTSWSKESWPGRPPSAVSKRPASRLAARGLTRAHSSRAEK